MYNKISGAVQPRSFKVLSLAEAPRWSASPTHPPDSAGNSTAFLQPLITVTVSRVSQARFYDDTLTPTPIKAKEKTIIKEETQRRNVERGIPSSGDGKQFNECY